MVNSETLKRPNKAWSLAPSGLLPLAVNSNRCFEVPDSSGPGRYPNDQVPSLVFGGQGDPYYPDFPGQYASIPGTTSKMLAMFLQNSQYSNMHNIARNPLGTHGTDAQVARYGLSFLELYLVGDARYQQFLVTDAQLQLFGYVP